MEQRYLDDVQDEEYRRSSLYGDAACEAESRQPVYDAAAMPHGGAADSPAQPPATDAERICLSGRWLMKGCAPADPGDPAPNTGWFGRRATPSPGMAGQWYASGCDRSDWHEVTVPTTVQRALVQLGELADPYWDTNTIDELEAHGEPKETPVWFRRTRAERQDWWFARRFEVPGGWRGRRVTLRFDGIDYAGSVYLNGVSLGHHAGMFGGPELDVSRLLTWEGANELVVRIDQAPRSWNGILKGSPGFGWHYGHLISLGIWKDVWLRAEPDIALLDPHVVTQSIGADGATLGIEYTIDSAEPGRAMLTVAGEIAPIGGAGTAPIRFSNAVEAPFGRSRHRTVVRIADPALWWPAGYGEPALYRLSLGGHGHAAATAKAAQESDGGPEAAAPRTLTVGGAEVTFGIRTIEMLAAAGARPEADYRWQFTINGVPMFIKGANWCWPDPLLEQREALYARLIGLARRGHVQMLRAWGGGIVEEDVFYRLCDEAGIMVYQEFPLCWGPMDAPHTDFGTLDRQVAASVKRLRNHPSLVMWGGGNENGAPGGADEALHLVGRRCRGLDPSRPYHRTDPWGGSAHNWDVYHGGEPLDAGTLGMPAVFYGEYGIPSMPDRSGCARFLPAAALDEWPPTEASRGLLAHFHQFALKDIIKVMRYGAYGPIRDWDTYIAYSQAAQGEAIRFAAELQRAGAGEGKTGFWYYKLTDLFPGHSWGTVDFYGTPKLSYYEAKRACAPRSAFATFDRIEGWEAHETFTAAIHAANDTSAALRGAVVSAVVYDSGLGELWSARFEAFELAANGRQTLGRIALELPDAARIAPFLLSVRLEAGDGAPISDQWYAFNAQPKTADLLAFESAHRGADNEYPGAQAAEAFALYAGLSAAPLRELPSAALALSVARSQAGGGTIRIRNVGTVPAVRVTIEGFPEEWSCYLADNGIGLRPGEMREIGYEADAEVSLAALSVGAWNAPRVWADGAAAAQRAGDAPEGGNEHGA
ncbi:glycoside hydrolase family 2 protein [Cohnella sp. 56]|uniref:glycoside hydrolase family 2 protein n=1 Tax=Cohnella sp. 56 TaxID=3113722 RepID=UPI0030E820AC